ncbi:type II toxin-antitoxin system RelE/ParE family toxin [Vreelandella titanicae]|mgnify:FL=1|jgi:toxin ParE1/3/4|uniref:type II toxin-antitoxin system RelE/ParE family toxin n=1 Tax=Vreelandella titanicae TaxID=664683 RepID=UPI003FD8221D|tara:strand:- start:826 stop:1110 length:285 start_codon:yes stop_codon:yes gene_type:complete
MKIKWLRRALNDLESIADYIALDNPIAALAMIDAIESVTDGLVDHPKRGRDGRMPGTRELVIPDTAYISVYRLKAGRVEILRVLHSAQNWPHVE